MPGLDLNLLEDALSRQGERSLGVLVSGVCLKLCRNKEKWKEKRNE